jgi:hypothetical protein
MMSRIFSLVATFAIFASPANGQGNLTDLLELIPEACQSAAGAAIPCYTANPICLTTIQLDEILDVLANIPEITACSEAENIACPTLTSCEPCFEQVRDLVNCVIVESDQIFDAVNGCTFYCAENSTGTVTEAPSTSDSTTGTTEAPSTSTPSAATAAFLPLGIVGVVVTAMSSLLLV